MTATKIELVVSLTDSNPNSNSSALPAAGTKTTATTTASVSTSTSTSTSPSRVGGKASSLARLYATEGLGAKVPTAHALTVDFFAPWIEELLHRYSDDFGTLYRVMENKTSITPVEAEEQNAIAKALCSKFKASSLGLALSHDQSEAIRTLVGQFKGGLAAVRSSAPEEDGSGASFAGAFETKLAVETTFEGLEEAVKACFASLWEYRVLLYKQKQQNNSNNAKNIGFAVVVMEMVDSVIAGVAFSANPLNSDRDELVIDSSWGLGESVVDGSVTADRYVVDKIRRWTILEESIGNKGSEKRLGATAGGVLNKSIGETDPRYSESSLSRGQIEDLSELVCLIENTYGMPMDIEWAFVEDAEDGIGNDNGKSGSKSESKPKPKLIPKLLQARPITTLFSLDPEMMTKPGEKRLLYFDINIISEATTTSPFTTMDMDCYCKAFTPCIVGGSFGEEGLTIFNYSDSRSLLYNGMTRQYFNMGWAFNYIGTEKLAKMLELMDPYAASIVGSKDCDRKKYRTRYWMPKGLKLKTLLKILLFMKNMFKVTGDYMKDIEVSMENYLAAVKADMERFDRVAERDFDFDDGGDSLFEFATRLLLAVETSLLLELSLVNQYVLPTFNAIDEPRRNGKTEEIKEEYGALCAGFEGDELMEMNIALYRLAQFLPQAIWKEYVGVNGMLALAERIREERDLPADFLNEWKYFMKSYGYDGQDQLFIGCPRYNDSPERLLEKMRMNAMGHIKDPSVAAKEQVEKRRSVMAKQEEEVKREVAKTYFSKKRKAKKLAKIQRRNLILEHIMWVRNAPKLRLTKVVGAMRTKVLKIEEKLIAERRLEEKGDIFHLKIEEVDRALLSKTEIDLMKIIRPRKAVYERALAANTCPLLVDSRCRILKPDPPATSNEPGTLVGAAISPGVAIGKVRIIRDLSAEQTRGFGAGANGERENHVLCAVVTGPAWTPLFASACAVVLQIGGALQHGALCAREYGKPAVSNIDVYSHLRDGMTVSVDGNTGIVKILEDGDENL